MCETAKIEIRKTNLECHLESTKPKNGCGRGAQCNRHSGKPQAVPNELRKEWRRARIFSLVATVNPVFGLTVGS